MSAVVISGDTPNLQTWFVNLININTFFFRERWTVRSVLRSTLWPTSRRRISCRNVGSAVSSVEATKQRSWWDWRDSKMWGMRSLSRFVYSLLALTRTLFDEEVDHRSRRKIDLFARGSINIRQRLRGVCSKIWHNFRRSSPSSRRKTLDWMHWHWRIRRRLAMREHCQIRVRVPHPARLLWV